MIGIDIDLVNAFTKKKRKMKTFMTKSVLTTLAASDASQFVSAGRNNPDFLALLNRKLMGGPPEAGKKPKAKKEKENVQHGIGKNLAEAAVLPQRKKQAKNTDFLNDFSDSSDSEDAPAPQKAKSQAKKFNLLTKQNTEKVKKEEQMMKEEMKAQKKAQEKAQNEKEVDLWKKKHMQRVRDMLSVIDNRGDANLCRAARDLEEQLRKADNLKTCEEVYESLDNLFVDYKDAQFQADQAKKREILQEGVAQKLNPSQAPRKAFRGRVQKTEDVLDVVENPEDLDSVDEEESDDSEDMEEGNENGLPRFNAQTNLGDSGRGKGWCCCNCFRRCCC